MDIADLTTAMQEFVREKGWELSESTKPQSPRNLAMSLAIEAAEVLEHFQWSETVNDKEALGSELADVGLYWLQLGSVCDVDLEAAILKKLGENRSRSWD